MRAANLGIVGHAAALIDDYRVAAISAHEVVKVTPREQDADRRRVPVHRGHAQPPASIGVRYERPGLMVGRRLGQASQTSNVSRPVSSPAARYRATPAAGAA